jgi:hypothetical protein
MVVCNGHTASASMISQGRGIEMSRRHKDDFYPTPVHATAALLSRERFEQVIWEPAAGDGALAEVCEKAGYGVIASDLNDYGYCKSGVDFLMEKRPCHPCMYSIISNPPYKLAEQFISHAIELGTYKHAWLLRLSFLEGINRYWGLFAMNPPARVLVFSRRLTIWRGDEDITSTGTTAYAWFIWYKGYADDPRLEWITDAEE